MYIYICIYIYIDIGDSNNPIGKSEHVNVYGDIDDVKV